MAATVTPRPLPFLPTCAEENCTYCDIPEREIVAVNEGGELFCALHFCFDCETPHDADEVCPDRAYEFED